MQPLMEKQAPKQDKRCPIQVHLDTKNALQVLSEVYNTTYDEVIRALIKFYNDNGQDK